jgi:hypothetical protein
MVSIKLRASEYWSKVIKRRQFRDPRLRGIVRKQTTLLHPEMTLANPASKQGRAEVAPNDPIYPPFKPLSWKLRSGCDDSRRVLSPNRMRPRRRRLR